MNIKVMMKCLLLEISLIELRLCLIKNNIIILISLSNPYQNSSLLECTSSIIFNLNSIFDPCTYTSINLQDNDTNPIIITTIIIQIFIPIPQVSADNPSCPTDGFSFKLNKVPSSNSTFIPDDITDSVNTSDHNLNLLWEVINILFLLKLQRSWILNLKNQFSIQKMDFNKGLMLLYLLIMYQILYSHKLFWRLEIAVFFWY